MLLSVHQSTGLYVIAGYETHGLFNTRQEARDYFYRTIRKGGFCA